MVIWFKYGLFCLFMILFSCMCFVWFVPRGTLEFYYVLCLCVFMCPLSLSSVIFLICMIFVWWVLLFFTFSICVGSLSLVLWVFMYLYCIWGLVCVSMEVFWVLYVLPQYLCTLVCFGICSTPFFWYIHFVVVVWASL